jgi:hypothetical protein
MSTGIRRQRLQVDGLDGSGSSDADESWGDYIQGLIPGTHGLIIDAGR